MKKWEQIKKGYEIKRTEKQLGFSIDAGGIKKNLDVFNIHEGKIVVKGWIFSETELLSEVCIHLYDGISNCRYELQYGNLRTDVEQIFENANGRYSGFFFEAYLENVFCDTAVYLSFRKCGEYYGWKLGDIPAVTFQDSIYRSPVIENRTRFVLDAFLKNNYQPLVLSDSHRTRKLSVLIWLEEVKSGWEHQAEELMNHPMIKNITILSEDAASLSGMHEINRGTRRIKYVYCKAGNGEKYILHELQKKPFLLLLKSTVYLTNGNLDKLLHAYWKYCRRYKIGSLSPIYVMKDSVSDLEMGADEPKTLGTGILNLHQDISCTLFCGMRPKNRGRKSLQEYCHHLEEMGYLNYVTDQAWTLVDYQKATAFMGQYLMLKNYPVFCQQSCELAICHGIGGGAQEFIHGEKLQKLKDNNIFITVTYQLSSGEYEITIEDGKRSTNFVIWEWEKVSLIFDFFHIQRVHVNELVTYLNTFDILESLCYWKEKYNYEMIFYFHDYYAMCPRFTLMNEEDQFCGLPDVETCQKCAKSILSNIGKEYKSVIEWRKKWGDFIRTCDSVITFSDYTRKLIEHVWGECQNLITRYHRVTYLRKVSKAVLDCEHLRIGIMGTINRHKGSQIVNEMCQLIEKENYPVQIVLIGKSDEIEDSLVLKKTGAYNKEKLPDIIEKEKIDIIFIPSVWPETFSYTAQEAIEMGVPVAVFNIGAPPERVKYYSKGLIIDKIDSQYALKCIVRFMSSEKIVL